jgi:hypothetical protein
MFRVTKNHRGVTLWPSIARLQQPRNVSRSRYFRGSALGSVAIELHLEKRSFGGTNARKSLYGLIFDPQDLLTHVSIQSADYSCPTELLGAVGPSMTKDWLCAILRLNGNKKRTHQPPATANPEKETDKAPLPAARLPLILGLSRQRMCEIAAHPSNLAVENDKYQDRVPSVSGRASVALRSMKCQFIELQPACATPSELGQVSVLNACTNFK